MLGLGNRNFMTSIVSLTMLVILLSSCGNNDRTLPSATGSIYECVVVCNDNVYQPIQAVMAADMPCLPQMEPYFNLSHITPALFDDFLKSARNVLLIDINENKYTQVKARYYRDAWSTPQVVCRVQAPSADHFTQWWTTYGEQIRDWFVKEEISRQTRFLKAGTNKEARQALKQHIGCDMFIPSDYVVVKDTDNLVWCCNNKGPMRKDIVVYRYPYTDTLQLKAESLYSKRDEVMGKLVSGSVEGSYMGTEYKIFPPQCKELEPLEKDSMISFYGYEIRGLWRLYNGEAMGGPYVSHTLLDYKTGYIITAETFLYASGQKKRNALRQQEAVLYTITIP